uniref:Roadblock/LAMTOR2 domain-containing protein n=1 Tax=Nothobranchius furzeri TaxID=105023 RepID=A0A8C6P904_NOTFU
NTHLQNCWRRPEPFCAMIPIRHQPHAEVEDTLKRIEAREDVVGIIIVNLDGVYLRSTLDDALTAQYTKHLDRLTVMARSVVRNIDPEDDLTSLRLRIEKNDKHEIMVEVQYVFIIVRCV